MNLRLNLIGRWLNLNQHYLFSSGIEAEITVSNSLPYPVEFNSLEFDKQYIEEEEVSVVFKLLNNF